MPSTVTVAALSNGKEGGSDGAFRFTRDGDTSSSLSFNVSLGGSSVEGTDYTHPLMAYFPANESTVDYPVYIWNDSTVEPTESVEASVASGYGYTAGSGTATVLIFDNETPEVTIEPFADASEDGQDGLVKLTRIGDLSSAITVNFSRSGTATVTTDYTSGTSLLIPANSAEAFAAIAAEDDDVYDPDETVIITLSSGTGYTIGTSDDATVYIVDSAAATFTLGGSSASLKFDIPWEDVDPEEATQSLPLSNFSLTFAGETFTDSNADYISEPTAEFEYGDFIGIAFAINTASVTGYTYTSVSAVDGVASAVLASNNSTITAAVADTSPASITLDFSTVTIPTANAPYTIRMSWYDVANNQSTQVEIEVTSTSTAGGLRDSFATAISTTGLITKDGGDSRITLTGPAGKDLKTMQMRPTIGTMNAPTVVGRSKGGGLSFPVFNWLTN